MRKLLPNLFLLVICSSSLAATSKPHLVTFGKWQSAKWLVGATEDRVEELRIRPLFVDGRLKEYTTSMPHDVTDRLFAVRRVFHLNDSLPIDKTPSPRWLWQRGGWIVVDRVSGHITPLALPDFDAYLSAAGWYRDYIAYCGVSDDGTKLFAVVMQLGRRKPWLHKGLGPPDSTDAPDSGCAPPVWERQPARVSFFPKGGQQMIFSIRRRAIDIVQDTGDDEEGSN